MTNESKMELYNAMIQKLDKDHQTALSNQQALKGNNLEIRNQVGSNMVFQRKYEDDRRKLVSLLNEATPLSKGVQEYLQPKVIEGKMDVMAGTATIDRSLETEGKEL